VIVTLGVAVFIALIWGIIVLVATFGADPEIIGLAQGLTPIMVPLVMGLLADGWVRSLRRGRGRQDDDA